MLMNAASIEKEGFGTLLFEKAFLPIVRNSLGSNLFQRQNEY